MWRYSWTGNVPKFWVSCARVEGPFTADTFTGATRMHQGDDAGHGKAFLIDTDVRQGRTYVYSFIFLSDELPNCDVAEVEECSFPLTIPLSPENLYVVEHLSELAKNPIEQLRLETEGFAEILELFDQFERKMTAKIKKKHPDSAVEKIARLKMFLSQQRDKHM
jgi:hypothetical protein